MDRLRSSSELLEPLEHLDPVEHFQRSVRDRRERDARGLEFAFFRESEATAFPAAELRRVLEGAREGLATVSDTMNPNSHYCISVLKYVDALASAIVEHVEGDYRHSPVQTQ